MDGDLILLFVIVCIIAAIIFWICREKIIPILKNKKFWLGLATATSVISIYIMLNWMFIYVFILCLE